MPERAPTYESLLPRLEDPKRPFRFQLEKLALVELYTLTSKGFLQLVEFNTLLKVYDEFLSSKGF